MVSPECSNCYAMILASRFCKEGQPYHGLATRNKGGLPMWTGNIGFFEHKLNLPLQWRSPRLIFVNSTSDLFHEELSINIIRRGFDVMEKAHWHVFQTLTKRSERMQEIMSSLVLSSGRHLGKDPLPNVWLGVSVGLEKTAVRIKHLCETPAAIRFVSAEPLIEPVNWRKHLLHDVLPDTISLDSVMKPDWVIFGGESQVGARPCPIDNIREGIEVCREFGIAPYVKQLGRIWSKENNAESLDANDITEFPVDLQVQEYPIDVDVYREKAQTVSL